MICKILSHANIITLFQFNSRILVKDFVVGICYSFLVFHEINEMKYRARRCINGTEIQYMLMNYISCTRGDSHMICWLQFSI